MEEAVGSIRDGLGSYLLTKDGKSLTGDRAPTLAFNYAPGDNMAGEQILQLSEGRWPEQPGEITLDTSSAERGVLRRRRHGHACSCRRGNPRRTFTLVGTADFNGGGTAGASLVLLDTAEAQEIFLDGQDAFTSVSLTAADGVSQAELAEAAAAVVPEGFTAVTGDKVAKESQQQLGQFLDVISYFLVTLRRDRDRRRRLHHLQHLLDPGVAAGARVRPPAGARCEQGAGHPLGAHRGLRDGGGRQRDAGCSSGWVSPASWPWRSAPSSASTSPARS